MEQLQWRLALHPQQCPPPGRIQGRRGCRRKRAVWCPPAEVTMKGVLRVLLLAPRASLCLPCGRIPGTRMCRNALRLQLLQWQQARRGAQLWRVRVLHRCW